MDRINFKFSDKFRSHWIKVKFYVEDPQLKYVAQPRNVRFCEATNMAITEPVLIGKASITCPGARYALGYENTENWLCADKRGVRENVLNTMRSKMPVLKKSYDYIGLNTPGDPDLLISYLPPEEVMNIIRIHNDREGLPLDVSLSTMMPVCGGVAVKSFLDEKISFSFGCNDSRKFAEIRRDHLAVGIPKNFFQLFVD